VDASAGEEETSLELAAVVVAVPVALEGGGGAHESCEGEDGELHFRFVRLGVFGKIGREVEAVGLEDEMKLLVMIMGFGW
jgi:hypothetical protein